MVRFAIDKNAGIELEQRLAVIHMGEDVTQGGAFNVGDDNADCGVKGHTVIVHKGCPAENPECTNGGDRIGCCVLA